MNRAVGCVFHSAAQSSFAAAVHEMWKLCKAWKKLETGESFSVESAEFGSDF
jgi:hypothetical protein